MTVAITVPGRPVPAVRMTQRSKWVSPSANRYLTYKAHVGWCAKQARFPAFRGPVSVKIRLYVAGMRFGDIDNYAKSIFDGLNGIAWIDDSQVVHVEMWRHSCHRREQRAEIEITEAEEVGA